MKEGVDTFRVPNDYQKCTHYKCFSELHKIDSRPKFKGTKSYWIFESITN